MIYILHKIIKEYAWGSRTAIPQLLGWENKDNKPHAELWMGTHPLGPSHITLENTVCPLPAFIARDPAAILGEKVAARYGNELPFLFKVLAIEKTLSFQAHPNPSLALEGFQKENGQGIPLDAPCRNYKDTNHKHEIICALTPFWLMQGFRPVQEIISEFTGLNLKLLTQELSPLKAQPTGNGLKIFFEHLMNIGSKDKEKTKAIIHEVLTSPVVQDENNHRYMWIKKLSQEHPADMGVLIPLLLHVIELQPGEAIFLPAGVLHTYLSGVGVELMTNSDNVIRGGLTTKHIDVAELIHVLDFSSHPLTIIKPQRDATGEEIYPSPANEFKLSRISLKNKEIFHKNELKSLEILLLTAGKAELSHPHSDKQLTIQRGEAVLVTAQAGEYRLEGEGEFYLASVPVSK